MIKIDNLTKYYPSAIGPQYIVQDLNFIFPEGHNIAILGRNGAGKSTLFRLLAGSEYPNKGRVVTNKSLSWPVALATGVHGHMTGRENARFIGRVNGVADLDEYVQKVIAFSGLDQKFDLQVRTYSSGMRSRLSFSCCISIDFDYYLIDEAISVADPNFRKKARAALKERAEIANLILVTHELDDVREFCDSAVVMHNGQLTFYPDLEQGISQYERL